MTTSKLERYLEAKKAREDFEKWQALPNGKKYNNGDFAISIAHCKAPKIERMGQKVASGNPYWGTGTGANQAILEVICDRWNELGDEVLRNLKYKENIALADCQSYVDDFQAMIDAAKDNP